MSVVSDVRRKSTLRALTCSWRVSSVTTTRWSASRWATQSRMALASVVLPVLGAAADQDIPAL